MRYNSRALYKNNEISHKLYTHFWKSMNMARIKFYGKPELQILVSLCNPEKALETYKERWQIETAFQIPEIQRIQYRTDPFERN
jgi:transposase